MMEDMKTVAQALGEYLPVAQPQFMPAGLALHITVWFAFTRCFICVRLTNLKGTTRMPPRGTPDNQITDVSVVDVNSKVHGHNNLWLGGCNVIPDSMACNPTRTAVRNRVS
jgi:choline dehydrogenase-like flavoprotein